MYYDLLEKNSTREPTAAASDNLQSRGGTREPSADHTVPSWTVAAAVPDGTGLVSKKPSLVEETIPKETMSKPRPSESTVGHLKREVPLECEKTNITMLFNTYWDHLYINMPTQMVLTFSDLAENR